LKKLLIYLTVLCVTLFGVTLSPSPVEASPSAYTYVQHVPPVVSGQHIQIKCHNAVGWTTLPVGDHSRIYCGYNGWVDSIRSIDGPAGLYARNISTGNVTNYGRYYQGPIGGGYYEVYLSTFCGGCGGGKHASHPK